MTARQKCGFDCHDGNCYASRAGSQNGELRLIAIDQAKNFPAAGLIT
jgi:hypothetical protein